MSNKQQLLSFLMNAEEPISGEHLSEQLGVSRTMIWKYIKSLKEDGHEVEAIKKKGYVLKQLSSQLSVETVSPYLETTHFARNLNYLESCPSTQLVANELLLKGDGPHGLVVISEEQTAGKGRLNRQWVSSKGKGLWTTWIVKPDLLPHEAPPITLVVALALAKAIHSTTGIQVDIKWPNDLLIDGKKVGGILTELQATPDKIEAILIGIGINVLQAEDELNQDLTKRATSLAIECDTAVDRTKLLAAMANELEQAITTFETQGFRRFQIEWERHSTMIGKKVTATTVRETIQGIALGLNEHGALLVQTGDGVRTLFSGDVTLSGKLDTFS